MSNQINKQLKELGSGEKNPTYYRNLKPYFT